MGQKHSEERGDGARGSRPNWPMSPPSRPELFGFQASIGYPLDIFAHASGLKTRKFSLLQILKSSCGSESSSPCREDNDTPKSRTAFGRGIAFSSRPITSPARSPRFATAEETDRLRVMISKSANFTFRVTVRPRLPVDSQCRQTLSISGSSSAVILSNAVRSDEKVLSAPTDFRIRLGRTGRSSTPREIQ